MLTLVSTALLAATLASCASPPSAPSTVDRTVQVEVVNAKNESIGVDSAADLRYASFALIQGSLTGTVGTEPVLYVPVTFGYSAQLPIGALAERIAPLAMPASERMLGDGLTVAPPDVRIARVGSFFAKREGESPDVGAGFLDDVTRETFFLVYFDRACSVAGTVRTGPVDITVDVRVQGAGMYWLRVRKDDSTHWTLLPDATQAPIALVTSEQR